MMAGQSTRKSLRENALLINIVLIAVGLSIAYGVYVGVQFYYRVSSPLFVVISGSMVLNLNIGDVVVIEGVGRQFVQILTFSVGVEGLDPSTLRASSSIPAQDGDVIVFNREGQDTPIVHRIVEKYQQGSSWFFRTKGDANGAPDPSPVRADHIIGKVVGSIPFIGYVSLWLRSPLGIALIAVAIVVLLVLEFMRTPGGSAAGRQED